MTWQTGGATTRDPEQMVLEADPYRRLSYTWHTFTPEWAEANGISEDVRARVASEPRSEVTFDIEPFGEMVKLTVTHDCIEPGGTLQPMISAGWPAVIASLKTLLETGEALPDGRPAKRPAARA